MIGGGNNGAMPVPKHEAGKVLRSKYLADLEESIKRRTPLKGINVDILYLDGGAVISTATASPIALTVCSNGTPSVITVVAYLGN